MAAGLHLAHHVSSWDWHELTVRNVAKQAGISERTVYRYFANERDLHNEIQRRIELESGAPLRRNPKLEDLPKEVAHVFKYLASFNAAGPRLENPPLLEAHRSRQIALLGSLAPFTQNWHERDRFLAAALIDALAGLETFDRLTHDWGLSSDDAAAGVRGLTQLLVDAVAGGAPPWEPERAGRRRQ